MPGPQGSGTTASGSAVPRSWSTLTLAAVILSAIGLVFAFASGIGMPVALAGATCGAVALRRDRAARPWPLVATLVGALGSLIAAVHLVILANVWMPLLPQLLR